MVNANFCMIAAISLFLALPSSATADAEIWLIRHGEKPEKGLGQLSCKGLNRALALPELIQKRYGRPDAVVAPNPGVQKKDKGVRYAYVRPLATVEPLAISLEMPVEATLGFNDATGLEKRFDKAFAGEKKEKLLVAWEHKVAEQVVRNFLLHHQINTEVPHWDDEDFDSIYVIRQKANRPIEFHVEKQGLNKLSDQCIKAN